MPLTYIQSDRFAEKYITWIKGASPNSTSDVALFTPTSGYKFVLMGFQIEYDGTTPLNVHVKDGSTVIFTLQGMAGRTLRVDLSPFGYISSTIDNVLNTALASGTTVHKIVAWGFEMYVPQI